MAVWINSADSGSLVQCTAGTGTLEYSIIVETAVFKFYKIESYEIS